MDSRRGYIKKAHTATCQWFLDHSAYVRWVAPSRSQKRHGLLWLKGKPGAGKSTLIKFALAHSEANQQPDDIVLSFFFNARGNVLERSTVGMYRSLLSQLFQKATYLQKTLDDFGIRSGKRFPVTNWTNQTLQELLHTVLLNLRGEFLRFFVDAMDECDEQEVREMIDFFEEVREEPLPGATKIHICFASRHYPTISIASATELVLETEPGHVNDLTTYTRSRLQIGQGPFAEKIKNRILEKANGVFMWVVLVIEILNGEWRRGRKFDIDTRLEELPPALSDLFKNIIRRDSVDMDDLLLSLQLLLYAKRPPNVQEFYFAMLCGIKPNPGGLVTWDSDQASIEDMGRFARASSKGLAEVTSSDVGIVQFIHESVREFLLKDGGLRSLWCDLKSDVAASGDDQLEGLSHDRLKLCCQRYWIAAHGLYLPMAPSHDQVWSKAAMEEASCTGQDLAKKLPFLHYALHNVWYHADKAATVSSQSDFLCTFPLKDWISLALLLHENEDDGHTSNASLIYVLAEYGCAKLIKTALAQGLPGNIAGGRCHYPVFAALANGHSESCLAVLRHYCGPIQDDVFAGVHVHPGFTPLESFIPLVWAIQYGHDSFAEALMTYLPTDVSDNISTIKETILNLLPSVAASGLCRVMSALLERDPALVHWKDSAGRTPLSHAAQRAQTAMATFLVDAGANINSQDNIGMTPLMWACTDDRPEFVRLLIEYGANIEAEDLFGSTALLRAKSADKTAMVELLLECGADENAPQGALEHAESGPFDEEA